MAAATLATSLTGSNNDIDWTYREDGKEGNSVSIAYVDPGAASASLSVSVSGLAISVSLATDSGSAISSTAAQVLAAVTGTKATNLLTSDNTAPSDGDTVTLGGQTYTFRTSLTASTTRNEVLINTTADAALLNLCRAINGSGTSGTDYGSLTLPHATVDAPASVTSHTILISAKHTGASFNGVITTESSSHLSFADSATLGGASATSIGVNGTASYLLTGALHAGNDGTGVVTALAATQLAGSTLAPTTGYADVATAKAAGWKFLGDVTTGKITLAAPQNTHNTQTDIWKAAVPHNSGNGEIEVISSSAATLLISLKQYAYAAALAGFPRFWKLRGYLDPATHQA